MGWYAMAFVDALDFIPEHESGRDSMLVIFNKIAAQIKRLQDFQERFVVSGVGQEWSTEIIWNLLVPQCLCIPCLKGCAKGILINLIWR